MPSIYSAGLNNYTLEIEGQHKCLRQIQFPLCFPPSAVKWHLRFVITTHLTATVNVIQLYLHSEQHYNVNLKYFNFCRINDICRESETQILSCKMFNMKLTCWVSSETPRGPCVPRGDSEVVFWKGTGSRGQRFIKSPSCTPLDPNTCLSTSLPMTWGSFHP